MRSKCCVARGTIDSDSATKSKIFLLGEAMRGRCFSTAIPFLGKGEFSIEDSDYGDYVVAELAKVL